MGSNMDARVTRAALSLRVLPMPTFELAAFESFVSAVPCHGSRPAEERGEALPRIEAPRIEATRSRRGIAGLLRLFSSLL
jgi:hypothetical protein